MMHIKFNKNYTIIIRAHTRGNILNHNLLFCRDIINACFTINDNRNNNLLLFLIFSLSAK